MIFDYVGGKWEIVRQLARERVVETMVMNIARQKLTPDLKDLSQMVYEILLDYDEDKIQDLWEHRQIRFFIARIIINQFRSSNSPFHTLYRKYQRMLNEDVSITRDADKMVFDVFGNAKVLRNED
ncbi:MAG: hypothetical protein ACI39U_05440 [Candidatus Cryptobacteroides sp.]